jgi:hypothetical protein
MTGASLLMSLSAYNTTGIGMLSTTFSTITGIVGLWGLWTVRPIDPSCTGLSDAGFIRSSSLALEGAQNLEQTSAPLPSYLAINLLRRKSRKMRRSNLKCVCSSFSLDIYFALRRRVQLMICISYVSVQVIHYLPRPAPPIILNTSDMPGMPPSPPNPPSPPSPPPICCIMPAANFRDLSIHC